MKTVLFFGLLALAGCTHTAGFVVKDITQRADGRIAVEQCTLETGFFIWAETPKLERCETKLVTATPHLAGDGESMKVGGP